MTTRLYFLIEDQNTARQLTEAMRAQDIGDEHIHAVARHDKHQLDGDIPEAGPLETSDIANGAKRGLVVGGTAGLFAGLTAATLTPLGLVAAGGAIAGLSAVGAAAGSWSASLVGAGLPNSDLKAFEDAIDDGKILMLADVDDDRSAQLKALVQDAYAGQVINSGEIRH